MNHIVLDLPWPPALNHYYRRVGNKTIISQKGRAYKTRVASIVRGLAYDTITEPITMHVLAHPPDRRRRDVDGMLKALLDAMEKGGLYDDDSQITKLTIEKRAPEKPGRMHILIEY